MWNDYILGGGRETNKKKVKAGYYFAVFQQKNT